MRSRLYRTALANSKAQIKLRKFNRIAGLVIIGTFIGISLSVPAFRPKNSPLEPLSQTKIETKQVIAEQFPIRPIETKLETPLMYIRKRGQALGYDDPTISRFINIARCESNFNPEAKNPNSTATGVFQIIIGTWDGNRCTGERWNYKDNINCAYKLLEHRGFQPWNASKHCWN